MWSEEILKAIINVIEHNYLFKCNYNDIIDELQCTYLINDKTYYYIIPNCLNNLKSMGYYIYDPPYNKDTPFIKHLLDNLAYWNKCCMIERGVSLKRI